MFDEENIVRISLSFTAALVFSFIGWLFSWLVGFFWSWWFVLILFAFIYKILD